MQIKMEPTIYEDLSILEKNDGDILGEISHVLASESKAGFLKFFSKHCRTRFPSTFFSTFHLSPKMALVFDKVSKVYLFFNSMPLSFLLPNMHKAAIAYALLLHRNIVNQSYASSPKRKVTNNRHLSNNVSEYRRKCLGNPS